jgi:plastocyanin
MRFRRLVVISTLVVGLAAAAAACGGGGDDDQAGATASANGGAVVVLKDSRFEPADPTVRAGQPVVWNWKDRFVSHNIVGDGFQSRTQRSGTFTHTFAKPGTYTYRCTLHQGMTGTVTVTASQ